MARPLRHVVPSARHGSRLANSLRRTHHTIAGDRSRGKRVDRQARREFLHAKRVGRRLVGRAVEDDSCYRFGRPRHEHLRPAVRSGRLRLGLLALAVEFAVVRPRLRMPVARAVLWHGLTFGTHFLVAAQTAQKVRAGRVSPRRLHRSERSCGYAPRRCIAERKYTIARWYVFAQVQGRGTMRYADWRSVYPQRLVRSGSRGLRGRPTGTALYLVETRLRLTDEVN